MTRLNKLRSGNSSSSRDRVAEDLLDNIDGHIQGPDAYAEPNCLQQVLRHSQISSNIPLISNDILSSEAFHRWISGLGSDTSEDTCPGLWDYSYSIGAVEFFLTDSAPLCNRRKGGTQPSIQAVGRFCPETLSDYKAGFLDFCIQAQRVFIQQPARLFLHGLYLYGSLLEVWIFDRSGILCLQQLDVISTPYELSSILHSLRILAKHDLGENELIQRDGAGLFIRLGSQATLALDRIYLEDEPIAFSEDIVGQATTCYRAKARGIDVLGSDLVIKIKWRLAQEVPEEELLKLAERRGARGILSIKYEKTLCSTSKLRVLSHNQRYRKFSDPASLLKNTPDIAEMQNRLSESTPHGILACSEETSNKFQERLLTLIILSPAGRPLQSFTDLLDLLRALRDAIQAHRSLFQVARILHQDVSSGNIIIIDSSCEAEPHGILIDLDVAIDQAKTRGEPGSIIGTRPYMAVGVLLGRRHTYRHDLESFLYVLIRTVIANGNDNPPPNSRLRRWTQGDFSHLATLKLKDMEDANFRCILEEFPARYESLKPLAEQLRQILFPIVDGQLWTATDGSPAATNALYDKVIEAFNKHIALERSQLDHHRVAT